MPDLILHCAPGWMPSGSPDDMQLMFSHELGARLSRGCLPALFLKIWKEEIALDKIHLLYVPQSDRNMNTPDIRVELRPLYTHDRVAAFPAMLSAFGVALDELCESLAGDFRTVEPRVEYEILFKLGGGGRVGDDARGWRSGLPT